MPALFPEAMLIASADRVACREILAAGSRSFFAASHLLPRHVRDPATALYAFCRLADDAIDFTDINLRPDALAQFRDRLDRVYRNAPISLAVDRAFADAVHRFAIPREIPEALLDGLEWDAHGRRFETLSELCAYAARVAGTVGVMMALVMGARDRGTLARATDLGIAMQLTNIARDVGEDARSGRIYLPLVWMREEGLNPDKWLASPSFSPGVGRIVERVLDEADRLYRRSEAGIARLPLAARLGILGARFVYADIGQEIRNSAFDSVGRRAFVSARRKLWLLTRAATALPSLRASLSQEPALYEARFLVDAVEPIPPAARMTMHDRLVWVLDLLERVERRQIEARTQVAP